MKFQTVGGIRVVSINKKGDNKMVYVKSKYTGFCFAVWDSSVLKYDGWIYITKAEYNEYVKSVGLV